MSLTFGFRSATSLDTAQLPELRPAELWTYKPLASAQYRLDTAWNAACMEVNLTLCVCVCVRKKSFFGGSATVYMTVSCPFTGASPL